jgi:hypothetical protein
LKELAQKQSTAAASQSPPSVSLHPPGLEAYGYYPLPGPLTPVDSNIPIAPTLSWPTAAQAAAMINNSSSVGSAAASRDIHGHNQMLPSSTSSSTPVSANVSTKVSPHLDPQPAPFLPSDPSFDLSSIGTPGGYGGSSSSSSSSTAGAPGFSSGIASGPSYGAVLGATSLSSTNPNSLSYGLHFPPISAATSYSSGYSTGSLQTSSYTLSNLMGYETTSSTSALDLDTVGVDITTDQDLLDEADGIPQAYINGAIELSAGAKPFVPKSFVPSAAPSIALPLPSMSPLTVDTPFAPGIAFPSTMGIGVGVGGLWSGTTTTPTASILPTSSTGRYTIYYCILYMN